MTDRLHSELPELANIAIGRALRAVEVQAACEASCLSDMQGLTRIELFSLLDDFAPQLFRLIECAALAGDKKIYLGSVDGLADSVDEICNLGMGAIHAHLLNDWLKCRDLSHLLHGTAFSIEW
jgi:hypothetical protein